MLTSVFHPTATFAFDSLFMALGLALLLGVVIGFLYMQLDLYRKNFVIILSVLPALVSSVIMIVNGNLGASVAVLGAFGLVRFRSLPGSSRDIGFIFFAMAIGLVTGMGFLTMAILITLIIGMALLLLSKSSFGSDHGCRRTLRITVPEDLNYVNAFDDLFFTYTRDFQLTSSRTTGMGTMFELTYQIVLREKQFEKDLIDQLRCRNGNLTIILSLPQPEREGL